MLSGSLFVYFFIFILLLTCIFIYFAVNYLQTSHLKMPQQISPKHVAIIMDGNGRWAKERSLPRNLGHYKGVLNILKISKEAINNNIKVLSLYAFSIQNWSRPKKKPILFLTSLEYLMLR